VFGEFSYDITDALTVTAGERYYDFKEERVITTGGLFADGDNGVVDRTKSDGFTPRVLPGALAAATGIREGNRLPSVQKFQLSASGSYEWPVGDGADAFVAASFQHVGNRFTQPADQESNPRTFTHGLPFGGQPVGSATTVDLTLPSYQLVNLSVGVDFDNDLSFTAYVNNLFDENALLSFDRERGGRARPGYNVGQPRTIGMTARKSFRCECCNENAAGGGCNKIPLFSMTLMWHSGFNSFRRGEPERLGRDANPGPLFLPFPWVRHAILRSICVT